MNAALLMLSLSAGGDPAPACCGAAPAPVAAAPCDGCGSAKPGFLDKLKGRLGHKKSDCGCDACGGPTNLLDKLKGRKGKHHAPAADCGGCDPCASAAAPAAAPAPATAPADPPKDMPKPDAPKPNTIPKELPKTGGNPGAAVIPPLPVTPVSGPKLNGANSPY